LIAVTPAAEIASNGLTDKAIAKSRSSMHRPTIFISCVSSEFGHARTEIATLLTELGFTPEYQETFGMGDGELLAIIRRKIDHCDGLIQIVGKGYGIEPPKPPLDIDRGRISYTQFEFFYALKKRKKTWLLFASDDCSRDKPIHLLDLPREHNHPDPAGYQRERQELQRAYIYAIREMGHYRHPINDDVGFETAILRIKDELAGLRRSFRRWQIAVIAALVVLLVTTVTGISRQKHSAQETAHQIATAQETLSREVRGESSKLATGIDTSNQTVTAIKVQVAQIDRKLGDLPAPAPILRLESSPTGAAILRPNGLEQIGVAPLPLGAIMSTDHTAILNYPGYLPQIVALPSGAKESMQITLKMATLPVTAEPYRCALLQSDLVWIPSGSVAMGSPIQEQGGNASERPVTTVKISHGFWMARYELTNAEAALFIRGFAELAKTAPDEPAVGLTWAESIALGEQLTRFEQTNGRLPVGWRYDLPTEAEWELACRAGTSSAFFNGSDESAAEQFGWYFQNSSGRPHHVGEKQPNPLGLYDLYGNVEEWCRDWYGSYPGGTTNDYAGPCAGLQRVSRGGSFDGIALRDSRSASRQRHAPGDRSRSVGMRLILRPAP
jgi:formylglycine-generating enzyme required for sulfatase activity